jgi:hypothetical protein
MAQTPSGRPEVDIATTDLDAVKSQIVAHMQAMNYMLQDESKFRLQFTKELEGDQAMWARLAIGNSYSTTPLAEVTFNLAAIRDATHVVVFTAISTQMPFGQVNRSDMKGNNAWFNDFCFLLKSVKYAVEP